MHVRDGSWIVLTDLTTRCCRLERVELARRELRFMKKYNLPMATLVGLPYGATLTQDEAGRWVRCRRLDIDEFIGELRAELHAQGYGSGDEDEIEEEDEPAHLAPTGAAGRQRLLPEDVIAMKTDKTSVRDLLLEICKGSDSFKRRSKFSQEKYIKKKLQRHLLMLSVRRPDPITVSEAYARLGGLSLESCAYILNQANVCAGQTVLVFDHSLGYITSCIAQRMGLDGKLLFAAEYKGASAHLVKQFNLDEAKLRTCFREIPFELMKAACGRPNDFRSEQLRGEYPGFFIGAQNLEDALNKPEVPEYHKQRVLDAIQRRDERLVQRRLFYTALEEHAVDSCVVTIDQVRSFACDPADVASLLSTIYSIAELVLKPGGRLCVFHSNMQPLSDCYAYIKARKHTWTNCGFQELCTRSICTLPQRSHPQMENSIKFAQGFVMCATRMATTEAAPTPVGGEYVPF